MSLNLPKLLYGVTASTSMGILPDGVDGGKGGLGRMEGGAAGGERSTKKGVGRTGAERAGVTVVD